MKNKTQTPRNLETQTRRTKPKPRTQKPWIPNRNPQRTKPKPWRQKNQTKEAATAKEAVAIEPRWRRLQAVMTTGFVDVFSLDLLVGFLILSESCFWCGFFISCFLMFSLDVANGNEREQTQMWETNDENRINRVIKQTPKRCSFGNKGRKNKKAITKSRTWANWRQARVLAARILGTLLKYFIQIII